MGDKDRSDSEDAAERQRQENQDRIEAEQRALDAERKKRQGR